MEPSPSRRAQVSAIPRLSRLPVPRNAAPSAARRSHLASEVERHLVSSKGPASSGRNNKLSSNRSGDQSLQTSILPPSDGNFEGDGEANLTGKGMGTPRRAPPSLSDRTMETLSQIPPTPSPRRRRSSFFPIQTPPAPQSRPTSSLARARPNTSLGHRSGLGEVPNHSRPSSPEKRQLLPTSGNTGPLQTPSKIRVSDYATKSVPRPTSRYNARPSLSSSTSNPPIANPLQPTRARHAQPLNGARTFAGRPLKARVNLQDAFDKQHEPISVQREKVNMTQNKGNTSKTQGRDTKALRTPGKPANSKEDLSKNALSSVNAASPKSSAALRETIAKAKAAHAKAVKHQPGAGREGQTLGDAYFAEELVSSNRELLWKRISMARGDGRLNIAAMGLSDIPQEVLNMYDAENLGALDGSWYESVDLVRLVAADNMIEDLDERLFPDNRPEAVDDYRGSIFGGLETMDLHGNRIRGLPLGFRQLKNLTVLNLAKNSLCSDSVFSILNEIGSLRELRIADNAIKSEIGTQLQNLQKLEVLDLRNCGLTAVTSDIECLRALQTLDVAGNLLESLPFDAFAKLPLKDLDASHNRLRGTLICATVSTFASLKTLDVSHNALSSLADIGLPMPMLQSLLVAENRLEHLPNLSECDNLITLSASGNKISSTPDSLASLSKLKNVDLSCNDLKNVDERLSILDDLTVLRVANNPLRNRKFLTMNTEDLKTELRALYEPAHNAPSGELGVDTNTAAAGWDFKPAGTVERLPPRIDNITIAEMDSLKSISPIKSLILRQSDFVQLPASLCSIAMTLTSLDLSQNKLAGNSLLSEALSLPKLRYLNLFNNCISALGPFIDRLNADSLQELDISRNRLTELPALKESFPSLTTVVAADNKIARLPLESVRGLHVLDVNGNEIEHLDPKLGLLSTDGLRTLSVGANRFRVPRREVIDKGTEAILTWLRGRIPDVEM